MTTHSESSSREYQAWWRMKQNCNSKNYPGYRNHGAKGIQICSEWKTFVDFLEQMGPMPFQCNALIRIDKSIDYCKINCKWGYMNQGRPRSESTINTKLKRGKISNPKTLCITIEKDHYEFINSQALKMSQEKGKIISVNDLIRESLARQFPAPKIFDMFGCKK